MSESDWVTEPEPSAEEVAARDAAYERNCGAAASEAEGFPAPKEWKR